MMGEIWRNCARRGFAALAVLLAFTAGASGASQQVTNPAKAPGQPPPADIRDLSLWQRIPFPIPRPAALLAATKCDEKGNIYLVQSSAAPSFGSDAFAGLPVQKLSIDSKSIVSYPVPTLDRYSGVNRLDFDVSPEGKVYALLYATGPDSDKGPPVYFVAKYKEDGTLDSYIKLGNAPEGSMMPDRLSVFGDGSLLITGVVGNAMKDPSSAQPFVGVFDSSGNFAAEVNPTNAIPTDSTARGPKPGGVVPRTPAEDQQNSKSEDPVALASSSFIRSAPDGYVYLLRSERHPRIYAVSSAGEIVKAFDVPVPAPGLTATNLSMSGDYFAAVSFGVVLGGSAPAAPSDAPRLVVSVVNPQSGEVSAVYRLPAGSDAFSSACAVSSRDFAFAGASADGQHLEVLRYR